MTGPTAPACPGCGDPLGRTREPLCASCWQQVPAKHRSDIHKAQKDVGRHPANPAAVRTFHQAIAEAMGAVRS